ncbi:MAG: ABC transporter ATP-binding protein [Rhizobiales bacterium]|nr:ABC transporter ATP-binding protein [Hyphomicrobiales bacterium]
MADLQLKNIYKSFGTVEVLCDINLKINSGEFVVFIGPSGCGKSTLLRLIAGLEEISSGDMLIDDTLVNDFPPVKRGIAMVFQSYALYPHMTVFENMAFGLKLGKMSKHEMNERVRGAAKILQITEYLERLPKQLSGGQRQRVAIGRAIVRKPKLFLFDEPLSNLDAALRVETRIEIANLHGNMADTTMIYVTHDQVEAMTLADRIVVMNMGNIQQVGTPLELYENPKNIFVAGFIGSPRMNFLEGANRLDVGAHTIGIRPEHLEVSQQSGTWAGEVGFVEQLGSDTFVHVNVPEVGTLVARVNGTVAFSQNAKIFLSPLKGHLHLFSEDGQAIGHA